jgi:exonuclease SbcC
LQARLDEAETTLRGVVEKIQNNEMVRKDSDKILAAVKLVGELTGQIQTVGDECAALKLKLDGHARNAERFHEQHEDAEFNLKRVKRSIEAIEKRIAKKDEVAQAKLLLAGAEETLAGAEARLSAATAEVERLAGLSLSSVEDRARTLLNGHKAISEIGKRDDVELPLQSAVVISNTCVEGDEEAQTLAKDLPGQRRAAQTAQAEASQYREACRGKVDQVKGVLRYEADIVEAERELAEATETHNDLVAKSKASSDLEKAARRDYAGVMVEWQASTSNHARLLNEKAEAELTARFEKPLADAETRLSELCPQRDALELDIAKLKDEVTAIKPGQKPKIPDTYQQKLAVSLAETSAREAHSQLAIAQAGLEKAKTTHDRVALLVTKRDRTAVELAHWNLLAGENGFGRDGLQALEIDAAGPELSATINDLLQTCIGPRWAVSVETTKMSADSKRQLEGCDVMVTDNETGRIASGEAFSGGQKVIIGEAISLALTMLACRRSGIVGATLVRDESGAALSPTYAPRYVGMLRRAAELIGAAKILFVSHNPETHDLADSVININSDGTVTVK